MEMSNKKEAVRQNKQREKEKIKHIIKNVGIHWPDLPINEELLRTPTPNFVKNFYGRFYSEFQTLTNNVRTTLKQEAVADKNILNDKISLTFRMNQICTPLGIPFNLNDLCEPQPKRTVLYFMLLINLINYMKTNTEYFDEIAECEEKNEEYKNLKEAKVTLLNEIEHSKQLDIQIGNDISKLSADIESLNKEYKEVLNLKTTRDYKYQQDYITINKIKDDINNASECLGNMRKESVALQEQIVSEIEVENFKKEIEMLKNEFDKLDGERINATSIFKEQQEKINYYKRCLILLQSPIFSSEYSQELKKLQKELTVLNQSYNKVNEEIDLKKIELTNTVLENLDLHKNVKDLQEELEILKNDTTNKLTEMDSNFINMELKIRCDKDVSISVEKEIQQIERICSELNESISTVQSVFKDRYEKFIGHKKKVFDKFDEICLKYK